MAAAQIASIKEEFLEDTVTHETTHTSHAQPVSLVDLEERILQLCSEFPKGISDDTIIKDQPLIDVERRMKALQRLLSQGKIDLLKQGTTLLYRAKVTSATTSNTTKGFDKEERLIYQITEDAGNKGIWFREIKRKSNLSDARIQKILKTLESKKVIKSVKSVQASKRKMYMLYDVKPDESLTGGAWYSDQEFESEFIEVLNQHCFKFLQQKAFKAHATYTDPISRAAASLCSTKEVCKFITELGISKVTLSVDDIRMILDMLIYDGRAEVQVTFGTSEDGESEDGVRRLYRVANPVLQDTGFSRTPCGICPVIDQCVDGGAISPSTCFYMKEWLKF